MNTHQARAQSIAHAREAGRWAAEAGRPITNCPTYAMGELGREWREAWKAGHREASGDRA